MICYGKRVRTTNNVAEIVQAVVARIEEKTTVEVEASARHIHLDIATVEKLFGKGFRLQQTRPLSQPGQFVSQVRLTLIGPKGRLENVAVLGPERSQSQVELSYTDAMQLGLQPPLRESGMIEDTPGITLSNGEKKVDLTSGVIIAQRHIHMTPADAELLNLKNGEVVKVKVDGPRRLIFDEVVIRVSEKFATKMHIDFDEANACAYHKGMRGLIIKE